MRGESERRDNFAEQRLDGRNLPLKSGALPFGSGGLTRHLEAKLRRGGGLPLLPKHVEEVKVDAVVGAELGME